MRKCPKALPDFGVFSESRRRKRMLGVPVSKKQNFGVMTAGRLTVLVKGSRKWPSSVSTKKRKFSETILAEMPTSVAEEEVASLTIKVQSSFQRVYFRIACYAEVVFP